MQIATPSCTSELKKEADRGPDTDLFRVAETNKSRNQAWGGEPLHASRVSKPRTTHDRRIRPQLAQQPISCRASVRLCGVPLRRRPSPRLQGCHTASANGYALTSESQPTCLGRYPRGSRGPSRNMFPKVPQGARFLAQQAP